MKISHKESLYLLSIGKSKCSKCKEVKDIKYFSKCAKKKNGLKSSCKECIRKNRFKNRDDINKRANEIRSENPEKYREKARKHFNSNREEILKKNRDWYGRNKEKRLNSVSEYQKANREKENKRRSKRYQDDIQYRIMCNLRIQTKKVFKEMNMRKPERLVDLLGCSMKHLKEHIEKQFTKGMTWDNHAQFGWHIDHIKPIKSFDLTKKDERKECFHYTNLQPLWWIDNLKKGAKYE